MMLSVLRWVEVVLQPASCLEVDGRLTESVSDSLCLFMWLLGGRLLLRKEVMFQCSSLGVRGEGSFSLLAA
jgi:hypothetical protein